MHDDELELSDAVARRLIVERFPEWAGLAIGRIPSTGTVNAIVRIGERWAARFPLRAADPEAVRAWLQREARAGARLAEHSPVPVPRPVAIGEPGHGYPLPWSVQTWVAGTTADEHDVSGSTAFARDLAALVGTLRAVDTDGQAFSGSGRGGDLRAHDAWVALCLRRSEGLVDVARLRAMWGRLRELGRTAGDVMTHGDLLPGNVLVSRGRLVGLLDGGGFGPADPALDTMAAWPQLDDAARDVFRAQLGCDELEWSRGRAWALQQALGTVWYYAESNPTMARVGRRTLERLLATERLG